MDHAPAMPCLPTWQTTAPRPMGRPPFQVLTRTTSRSTLPAAPRHFDVLDRTRPETADYTYDAIWGSLPRARGCGLLVGWR